MNLTDLLKKMLHDYFIIVTGTLVCTIIFCLIFSSDSSFGVDSLLVILLFAAAGDIPTLLLYSKNELSEKQWLVRSAIHFIVLEMVLIGLSVYLGWVSNIYPQGFFMCLLITGVYLVVKAVNWKIDSKTTARINERLELLKKKEQ